MQREELTTKIVEMLEESGYIIATQYCAGCFDILAKNKDTILLIKILTNVDSFYEDQAIDLKKVARVLDATPLIIGETARGTMMKDSTVYERYGVPAINTGTFGNLIFHKEGPCIYSKRGGFYAHINADFLKDIIEQNNISLGTLAKEAGVSKTTLMNYEKGEGAEVRHVVRLQDALGDLILDPINLFELKVEELQEKGEEQSVDVSIENQLENIGFKTTIVSKASFNLIGKHNKDLLFTGLERKTLKQKAHDIYGVTEALDQHGMFILNKSSRKVVDGVPILEKEHLDHVHKSKELLRILEELSEV